MDDSLLPSRALRVFTAVASALWWLLVAFWLVLALGWGALHGWIVPRVGELRPQLEAQATRALGAPVRIGAVAARSEGLVPTFELRDVVVHDAQDRAALTLPRVLVAVSPRSLWKFGLEQLVVENPRVEVRRAADGRVFVAGMDVSSGGDDASAADWFFRQKEVLVRGGTLRWIDEQAGAQPLELTDLQFVSRNSVRRHALRLDATPPPGWGERFTLRGVFRQPLLSTHAGRWQDWSGQLHAEFASVDLAHLRPYGVGGAVVQGGRGALRAWIDVEQGRAVGAVADLALRDAQAQLAATRAPLALQSLSGRLTGRHLPDGGVELETHSLQFETADGRPWPGGNVALSWSPTQGGRGSLQADRLDLDALARIAGHLPLEHEQLRSLLRQAPAGLVEAVQARWSGPLAQPRAYQVRGRVVGLGVAAGAGLPGVRGASVEFAVSEDGGTARLQVRNGALELPGLIAQPTVPVERLAADLQWQQHADGRIMLEARGLELRNADLHAEGQASWRTGEGARGRFPGVLDLRLNLPRAEGTRVWRYLPMAVGQDVQDYVRQSVLSGKASEGRIRVRGDLRDFPFADRRSGEFRVSARVRDASYDFAPKALAAPAAGTWPQLTQLSGELVFEGAGMQVRNAQGRFAGTALQVQADASIADLEAPTVLVNGQVRGALPEALAVFNALPVAHALGQPLSTMTAGGPSDLRLRLALPLANLAAARVQGSVALAGNELRVRPDVPALSRVRGTVAFTESGFTLSAVQAQALGGDLRIEGGTRQPPPASSEPHTVLRIQGVATAEGLRQASEPGALAPLARAASGATGYSATLGLRASGVDVAVTSTLQGMALDLPEPLGKPAESSLPLRFELAALPDAARPSDQLVLELGTAVAARFVRDVSRAVPRVVRGAIGVGLAGGESAPLPPSGVMANVQLGTVSVDAWQEVFERLVAPTAPGATGAATATAATSDYLPTTLAVRARALTAQGRTLHNVVVGGSRVATVWRANVDADELNGYVEYRQPAPGQAGRVVARLARLSLAGSTAGEVESLLDEQPASVPALDVVVEDFELRGRRLGRLEIEAVNRGGAMPEWRLNKLSLAMPQAQFTASGNWAAVGAGPALRPGTPERRRTVMNFRLEIADSGGLLERLGMPGVVRRGRGKLEGQVAWLGSPLALDYPSMSGNVAVNVESGQFLKADPGLAKLLSVLSLQSLPRRLTLDFRDIFSEGFAFDFVRGHLDIEQGVAGTNNLQMKGLNAAVLMEGRADLARETQDLKVVVVPEINAGTASLVATVIHPAIGLGTFLAQMFLREPLMRAATQELHIDGTWAEPRVSRVPRRPEGSRTESGAAAAGPDALAHGAN
ncbi:YhdP family protein [Ramlibacter sp. AN1015]|uniref:YhdP family protein n=1 Tax=Ramlibacter sp. AN1015 TaxID=3133428 RepID=UPI0030BEEA53